MVGILDCLTLLRSGLVLYRSSLLFFGNPTLAIHIQSMSFQELVLVIIRYDIKGILNVESRFKHAGSLGSTSCWGGELRIGLSLVDACSSIFSYFELYQLSTNSSLSASRWYTPATEFTPKSLRKVAIFFVKIFFDFCVIDGILTYLGTDSLKNQLLRIRSHSGSR